jgi:hypothetical protein
MKKIIETSRIGNLLYETRKLTETDTFLKEWNRWPSPSVRSEQLLSMYGHLFPWVKAIALNGESVPTKQPFWKKVKFEKAPTPKNVAEQRFEECLSRNKMAFDKITKGLSALEKRETVHLLFAQFPSHLVAVWDENDDIFVNEFFLRESIPDLLKKGLQNVFEIQIQGEAEVQKAFAVEEKIRKKEFEDRINSRDYSTSCAGH